jgi:uncharacterized protein (TIGR00290 family)
MTSKEKAVVAWSSGKDCAMALYQTLKDGEFQIVGLLTTVDDDCSRVHMHDVRQALLEQQATSLGLPLKQLFVPRAVSDAQYESMMRDVMQQYLRDGVSSVVFGDLFLEDVRQYRIGNLAKIGMKAVFPLWKRDTTELARTIIDLGFKAVVTCVDSRVLDKRFAGMEFDEQLLSEIPGNVDPCGENGEFHSFVYDGPVFVRPIEFEKSETKMRDGRFFYCDLFPAQT